MSLEQRTWEDQAKIQGQTERLRWLVILRWIALVGVALAGTASQFTGYAILELDKGWWVLPPTVVYSGLFMLWLHLTRRSRASAARVERSLRWQAYLQSLCDIVSLSALTYLNGGVECPTVYIPILAILLDGLVLSRTGVFLQANLGAALFALMAVGEYQGWIPHINYIQEGYRYNLYQDPHAVLGIVLAMVVTMNLVALLMSSLGQRLNQAESRMRHLLGQLRQQVGAAAGQLAEASEGMRHGAREVNTVAEQVAATVHEIAQGSAQQAGQLEDLSRNLEQLADAARRVAEGAQETHQASENAVATTDRGHQAVREATTRMEEIARVFAQAEKALVDLSRRSEEIAEVALAIDRFAERTDLLALNAGTEAARAGEHGRGFAVVAGEVKKLAASSSSSAEQVADMVFQIQDEITRVVRSVQAGRKRVQDGQEAIVTLREVLNGMTAVITQAAELAGTMEHLSHQQRQSHQQIVRAVGNLASTAEETAAGAEETAAAVEQQVASFSEFLQTVQDLAVLAGQLDRSVTDLYGDHSMRSSRRDVSMSGHLPAASGGASKRERLY